MTSSLSDIQENVKTARENALLGSYDTSQVYYQGALQQIQKHLITVADPARKQKWQQVTASMLLHTYIVYIYSAQNSGSDILH